jgi:hypothetical protein
VSHEYRAKRTYLARTNHMNQLCPKCKDSARMEINPKTLRYTCLWLKGLPKLQPSNVVEGREQRIWKLPPSADRWKERSRTFPGIAAAMASQWGILQNVSRQRPLPAESDSENHNQRASG